MAHREKENNHNGLWNYAYHASTNKKQLQIPEPQVRVGPPGVSSGISFRTLPDASLLAIRQICEHYEKKCSGKYSSDSLSSRYIFQMTREINSQLQAMTHNAGGSGQRVRDLESVLTEWNENFGRGTEEGTQGVFGIVPMSPTALKNMLQQQRSKLNEYEQIIRVMEQRAEDGKKQVTNIMDTHVEAARLQAEAERVRHESILISMKAQCDADVERARKDSDAAKNEAKQAVEFDRARAEQTIATALHKERSEKIVLQEELKNGVEKLNREWSSKLRHLEIKVKNADESRRVAVERACNKLKSAHSAELAASVREASMKAGAAAMSQGGGSSDEVIKGSTSAGVKSRMSKWDEKRAGVGREQLNIEKNEVSVPLSADELNLGVDAGVAVSIGNGGDGGSNSNGRGGAGSDELRSTNSLLELKLKNQRDESEWLRGRVKELETTVGTMRTAIQGTMEVGAGEQEFKGWRQVVSVKYPWMRDREREDPARTSFQREKTPPFVLPVKKNGASMLFSKVQ